MKFEELDKRKTSEVESDLTEKFLKEDLLEETIENRKDAKNFVFYDGPATANPLPVKRYTKLISSNSLLNQGIIG